ncbi:MAG TPA: HD-GYP domain-containing protein [Solirubrobacteraceae bacterium]|jgi:HD-GYP domain-containing protein (c-di-GMP phosphodiesterase class II)|nr:HD-GYP domain-containing protein [Solirubrobacteraceae bacterium]
MSSQPTFAEQQLIAATRRRASTRMNARDLAAELVVGPGFLVVTAALCWLRPPHGFDPVAVLWCIVTMVLATRVQFETPFGFTVATQLAFVPLLFSMPVALVPFAVVIAVTLALVPDVIAGRLKVTKLLRSPGNAAFSIGPVLVFVIAGVSPVHAGPALLLTALGAQFAVDFAAAALRCRIAREATIRSQLGESWVYLIDAALSPIGLVVAREMHDASFAVLAVVPLLGLLAMFANERRGRLGSLLELNDTYRGTALLLGDVISADDGYTGEHSEGVVGLALAVGDVLGLDPERRRNLEFGAMLHDVGKIAIPKEIINKPGKLDAHEWEIIKTHPEVGERMLNRVGGFMVEVGKIVRHHHERWDGGGYPDGLAGEHSPLESRIIVCCDSWSAMRTDRAYRRALSYEAAMEQIVTHTGSQFDPTVVQALVAVVAESEDPSAAERPAQTPQPAPAASLSEGPVVSVADHEAVVVGVEAHDRRGADVAGDAQRAPQGAAA